MANYGENLVGNHLINIGLVPIKINEGNSKSPDFEVRNNENELLFYLEEKTVDQDDFFEGKPVGVVLDGNDPSENALESKFKKAAKQMKAVNESHSYPNVLAIVNLNNMVNCHDLFIALTGHAYTDEGRFIQIRRVGRVRNYLDDIDLCLWFEDGKLVNQIWISNNSLHRNSLKEVLNIGLEI